MPATLRRFSMTSFGHLICAERPVAPSIVSAAASAATSESSGRWRSAGGWSRTETSSELPGGAAQLPAEAPPSAGLVVGRRDGALGQPGTEQEELRRLALGLVAIRLAEARRGSCGATASGESANSVATRAQQRASTRTAETLNSGVPMSGSPTSCVSQFTFCSAKWSAIQTRPG